MARSVKPVSYEEAKARVLHVPKPCPQRKAKHYRRPFKPVNVVNPPTGLLPYRNEHPFFGMALAQWRANIRAA